MAAFPTSGGGISGPQRKPGVWAKKDTEPLKHSVNSKPTEWTQTAMTETHIHHFQGVPFGSYFFTSSFVKGEQ